MSSFLLLTRSITSSIVKINPVYLTSNHLISKYSSDCSTDKAEKKTAAKKKNKTPKGRFDDEYDDAPKSYNEKEPLEKFPNGVNPKTGEIGGPIGPEPTRYGDWERKGRVTDF